MSKSATKGDIVNSNMTDRSRDISDDMENLALYYSARSIMQAECDLLYEDDKDIGEYLELLTTKS